ncbi:MAG: hypothetical protein U9N62_08335, partial [Thermotogota bacterium]|nr:hypothetical protein [Thermotogota bacterium]
CPDCGCELSQEPVKGKERRQEIDIIIQRVTKEYRAEKKRCPKCSKDHQRGKKSLIRASKNQQGQFFLLGNQQGQFFLLKKWYNLLVKNTR